MSVNIVATEISRNDSLGRKIKGHQEIVRRSILNDCNIRQGILIKLKQEDVQITEQSAESCKTESEDDMGTARNLVTNKAVTGNIKGL